jgi:5'-deoxynucleotidase YfbR-like HD superfamily hydrolase
VNIADRVLALRDAGVVKRSHTCRTLMDRNVAEHSHGVAMLVLCLYQHAGGMPTPYLLAAALCHDLSEIATGDIPAPVKRGHPDLKKTLNRISHAWECEMNVRFGLTDEEQHLLLWCDRMDFALYALEEVTMGNGYFKEYLGRIIQWIKDMPLPSIRGDASASTELYLGVTARAFQAMNLDPHPYYPKGE